jgi:pimeloyl-ACP methyl ester carboxylesterase
MKPLKPIFLALAAFAAASAQAQDDFTAERIREWLVPYASAADVVVLRDGRKVGFTCMGEGSPTVILIPGMGDLAGMGWGNVQPEMAKTTRVCAWDRPGWGLSDGAEGKHTVATSTAALEEALANGAIPGPYVLVGHSLGGYESMLFADRHPDQVAGMVLVDSSFPDQQEVGDRTGLPSPDPEVGLPTVFRKCAAAIRQGAVKPEGPDPDGCFAYPTYFPPELAAALRVKAGDPIQYETMASFLTTFADDAKIVINPVRNFGDMPLTVLTAALPLPTPPDATPEEVAGRAAWTVEWGRQHELLAALSSRGINARVPGANHYIQRTKPRVVIDAVEAVVAEARSAGR